MVVTLRDRAIEMLAVGVGAGGTGSALGWFLLHGYKEEAVFSFLGAVVGAAATVAGAVWLADRTARMEQKEEIDLLIDEYKIIHEKAKEAANIAANPSGEGDQEYKLALSSVLGSAWECITLTTEALETGKRLTFRHRTRLREVLTSVTQFWDIYKNGDFGPHIALDREMRFPGWYVVQILISTDLALKQLRDPHDRIITRVPSPGELLK